MNYNVTFSVPALQFYRHREDVESHMEEMDTETQKTASDKQEEAFKLKELFSRNLIMPLFIACMLQIVQQFSGINAVRHKFYVKWNVKRTEFWSRMVYVTFFVLS